MAHSAKLSELAGALVSSITERTASDAKFKTTCERTLKDLKDASHARTNQFDVQSKLAGLVEKFAVLNRDDLAEGLQTRLDELPAESKWLPEILALLSELSDRPIEKTRLEDVEAASKGEDEQEALTWADIIADDPLDEVGIWDDVERGYHSSDDDFKADEDGSGDETQATSIAEDDPVMLARRHVLRVDDEALAEAKAAQKTIETLSDGQALSELTLVRETLSMLHGLPTSVFLVEDSTGAVGLRDSVRVETASKAVVQHALWALADIGSSLNALRRWAKDQQRAPTLRSCQSALAAELKRFSLQLAGVEQRYTTPEKNSVVSIVSVRTDIERLTRPHLPLAKLLQNREHLSSVAMLDHLYDQACMAQLSGENRSFATVSDIVIACLNTYLRPVLNWITFGKCDGDGEFFVKEAASDCDLGRLWRDRYALRQDNTGGVAAPTFLSPFINCIFALGKACAFLRALARDDDEPDANSAMPILLRLQQDSSGLLPFSQVLEDALQSWIDDQSRGQAPLLRSAILHDHGLLQLPQTLQHVFMSKNGRRFQTFADTLFWRLDHGARWRDDFLITELAQTTLGNELNITAEALTVQVVNEDERTKDAVKVSPSIRKLEAVRLSYHVPWPLQNVTGASRSDVYAKAFAFLLQIYRAKYLLRQHILAIRNLDAHTAHQSTETRNLLRLQQRLSIIVDIFHEHVTHASELFSIALQHELNKAEDIDAMAAIWQSHEKNLATSLLTAEKMKPVRDAMVNLLELSEQLMRAFKGLVREKEPEEEHHDDEEEGVETHAIARDFDSSFSFITAGLRGVGRAGGNIALEQLAERLEWAVH